MEILSNLPWYAYLFLAVFAGFFVVQKVLPVLKRTRQMLGAYHTNPSGNSLSIDQFRAIAIGAINGEQTSCYIDSLETGMQAERLDEGLRDWWDIYDADSAKNTLDWLQYEGHRAMYGRIYDILTRTDKNNWESAITIAFEDEEAAVKAMGFLENLDETVEELRNDSKIAEDSFTKGILAWDMGRMVTVARMAYDKQLITESEAWYYINSGLQLCQLEFSNWGELADSYIIGRAMWSGNDMMLDGLKNIAKNLQEKEKSPWKKVDLRS